MIQHIWTVPCQTSIIDKDTNNVSIIGVLEEIAIGPPIIHANQLATAPAMFDIVTLWAREDLTIPESGYSRTCLVAPDGEEIVEQILKIDMQQNKRLRAVNRIVGFPSKGAGVYYFTVQRRLNEDCQWGEKVARVPLEVSVDSSLEMPAHPGAISP